MITPLGMKENVLPRLRLKIKGKHQDLLITGERFVIGRTDRCDHKIPSGFISREHCEIRLEREGYTLSDLNSKMGTFLNGKKIGKAALNLGDQIKFGNHLEATFMEDDALLSHTETMVSQKPALPQVAMQLIALNGPMSGHAFKLRSKLTRIGRSEDNEVCIREDTISNHHAEVSKEGDSFVITDLESGNGTYVGKQLIKRQQLKAGDTILIARVAFRFEDVDSRKSEDGELQNEWSDLEHPSEALFDRTLVKGARLPKPSERIPTVTLKKSDKLASTMLILFGTAVIVALWHYFLRPLL